MLPGIEVFVSRADFRVRTGKEAPAYDPNFPVQCWRDMQDVTQGNIPQVVYPNNNPYRGRTFNLVIRERVIAASGVMIYGVAVLEPTFIPHFISARVNLPPDQSGIPVDDQQFPIRDLLPGETIVSSPFGISIAQ